MWNRSSPLYLLYEFQMPGRVQLFEELLYNHKVILAICPWLMNHKHMCSMLFYTLVPVYNLNVVYHQNAIFVHIYMHIRYMQTYQFMHIRHMQTRDVCWINWYWYLIIDVSDFAVSLTNWLSKLALKWNLQMKCSLLFIVWFTLHRKFKVSNQLKITTEIPFRLHNFIL